MSDLNEKRRIAADEEFSTFDFGYEVDDASGWEHVTPGNQWMRPVFLSADNPDAPSIPATLHVMFRDGSDEIAESHAVISGHIIPGRSSRPLPRSPDATVPPTGKVVKIIYQVTALMPAEDAQWARHSDPETALRNISEGGWIGSTSVALVETIPTERVRDELLAIGNDGTFFDGLLAEEPDGLQTTAGQE